MHQYEQPPENQFLEMLLLPPAAPRFKEVSDSMLQLLIINLI